jgi:hypothetical protein
MSTLEKAAQQALEALESLFSGQVDPERGMRCGNSVLALKAALAQQEQEPVAWMREGWGPDCGPYVEFYRNDEMGWRDRNGWTPLFTHPPRREWVSLTEEERVKIIEFGSTLADIARAVEAALKERNT